MSKRPLVVLCGPMGSGKSAVGRRLATLLEVAVLDTDTAVEERAGRSIATIFAEQGEAEFRELEHAAVFEALHGHDGVVSLGGGAVVHPGTRAELAAFREAGGIVVFLDVSSRYAMLRVGHDPARPLLHVGGRNPREHWEHLMAQRRPVYTEVSSHVLRTDRRTPGALARDIVTWVERA